MAEKEGGLIEGVLGAGEAEERESGETTARADDVATAVMMDAARFDPELSRKAGEYLDEQRSLVRLQVHHFDEERKLAIEAAKRKRLSDYFRMSLLLTVAVTIGSGAIWMLWDAVNSHSVMVDPIAVSSNVGNQAPDGKIISKELLDVLSHIQTATRTSAEKRSISNAWTSEIAIEIPETGLSISQIERMLKARFGHDQHIDGDVVVNEQGELVLTVRGTGIVAKTFTDKEHNLNKILTQAGEYIYGQSQPGLFTNYLANNDRADDAIHFAQAAYPTVDVSEKPFVLNDWANAIVEKGEVGASMQALPFYREALRLKPDYWIGYRYLMSAQQGMGDEEGSIRTGEQMMKLAGGRPGRADEIQYINYDQQVFDFNALHSELIVDMESHGGVGTTASGVGSLNLIIAQFEAGQHDIDSAMLRIKTTVVDSRSAPDVAAAAIVKGLLAEESGDLRTAATEFDTYALAYANPTVSAQDPMNICYAAPTYEKNGQPAKADAALAAPMKTVGIGTFVDCYRFQGDVLELRGDWNGAKGWYAKAVKLAPSMPAGYFSFGMALIKHGDLNGAAEQFKLANLKGPHWADPLKAWGDVLMKQGYTSQALGKYDEAAKYAPNWVQLKDARAVAVKARS